MNDVSDIASVSWTEESFENRSYTNTDFSAIDSQIKEETPTVKSQFVSIERCCSKRKKIIIFTIITILILIIVAMIVTMIALIKPNNTTTQTSKSTTTQISTSTTILNDDTESTSAITYDVGGGGISGGPPCVSYTVINDPSRNVDKPGIGGACDNGVLFNTSIGGRWIRFMGTGGTIIPSFSPGMDHCSAYLTGWSNVTLPSTTDTLVNGTVCFESVVRICNFETPMTVINCGSFYVYFLLPLFFCNARYCTI